MIEVVKLPIQTKNGFILDGGFTVTPNGYEKQIEKLDSLLSRGYRVHAVIPVEDRIYKGAYLILHKDSGEIPD